MREDKIRLSVLGHYFLFTYVVLLINDFSYLREIKYAGLLTFFFICAVYLTYSLIYLLPVFVPLLCLNRFFSSSIVGRLFNRVRALTTWFIYGTAVLGFTLLQILIFTDVFIFRIFGFHINGFVWNLVFTRGGIESLECGRSTTLSFIGIGIGFFIVQALLLIVILKVKRIRLIGEALFTKRMMISLTVIFFAMTGFQGLTYGMSSLSGYAPVLTATNAFPLYIPLTLRNAAKFLGLKVERGPSFAMKMDATYIRYPLKPINRKTERKSYNIVWLVAESLRADMVDQEIMPSTYAFARESQWFKYHYSGGNGTRMAMFSMFYGLYGSYWFPFLEEKRGPLIIDLLIQDGYQMNMLTSAKFTYPEFDKTIFTRISPECLHESSSGLSWQRDRENVSRMLEFLERRDPDRPLMTFMFFESPHAKYDFPRETAIRRPYLEELNYANMHLEKNVTLIKNRYINSCNHLDTQFQRILEYLAKHDLLDSTIVLITGDHGEAFMEKGRWGHNSDYSEEQTRVPLVLWIPGRTPREVTRMTSHLDIPATLFPLLGVTNPPEDYSLGFDLLGEKQREFSILCDWDKIAYVDDQYKAVFPTKVYGFAQQEVTTKDDIEVRNKAAFYESKKDRLMLVMKELSKFCIR